MRINQDTVDLVKQWEGLRLIAYQDTGGVWTIGYGHTRNVHKGMKISIAQAEEWLREELESFAEQVADLITVVVNPNQFGACVSLAYNIGITAFKKSTLLRKLNMGDFDAAADEFSRWIYDNGKVIQGLKNRRKDEQALFRTQSLVEANSPLPSVIVPTTPKNAVSGSLWERLLEALIKLATKWGKS